RVQAAMAGVPLEVLLEAHFAGIHGPLAVGQQDARREVEDAVRLGAGAAEEDVVVILGGTVRGEKNFGTGADGPRGHRGGRGGSRNEDAGGQKPETGNRRTGRGLHCKNGWLGSLNKERLARSE